MIVLYIIFFFCLNISFGNGPSTLSVPTLSCHLTVKDIIQNEHLKDILVPLQKVTSNILVKRKDIVGKQIRSHSLRPGVLIRVHDLKDPTLVKKGEMVRIIFKTPKLMMTNQGIAQKDGVKNETIPIDLVNTKRKIFAKVYGLQEVRVGLSY